MQSVGVLLGCLESVQQEAVLRCGHLGHVKCRQGQKPLELFQQMEHNEGVMASLCYYCGPAECMCQNSCS